MLTIWLCVEVPLRFSVPPSIWEQGSVLPFYESFVAPEATSTHAHLHLGAILLFKDHEPGIRYHDAIIDAEALIGSKDPRWIQPTKGCHASRPWDPARCTLESVAVGLCGNVCALDGALVVQLERAKKFGLRRMETLSRP